MTNDKQELIGQFHKNSIEIVKVSIQEFNGKPYVDMRIWALNKPAEQGSEVATKKGICISVELLPEMIDALEKARARIKAKSGTGPGLSQDQAERPQERQSGKD